jgi:hypothetical protein
MADVNLLPYAGIAVLQRGRQGLHCADCSVRRTSGTDGAAPVVSPPLR